MTVSNTNINLMFPTELASLRFSQIAIFIREIGAAGNGAIEAYDAMPYYNFEGNRYQKLEFDFASIEKPVLLGNYNQMSNETFRNVIKVHCA